MRRFILIILCVFPLFGYSDDYDWWNIKHGWEPGMPGWRDWMHISPGYLGPNALPVPEVKKGIVSAGTNIEFGFDVHFQEGDPTQNLFAKYYHSFANNKIAIELYGVIVEHYAMSEYIRDERLARHFEGKGFTNGDLYFSTLLQLVKDRKFPDTMVRFVCRTASGNQLDDARYSDSPGYFFDFSFSKEFCGPNRKLSIMPFTSFGFYSWQTNDEIGLQNDAYLYALGADLKWSRWSVSNSISGFSGYKKERDKPMVYTFDLNRSLKNHTLRLQYLYGLRDWNYQTVKFSIIWNLKK